MAENASSTPEQAEGLYSLPEFQMPLPKDAPVPEDRAFGDLFDMAREQDGIDMAILQEFMEPDFEADPNFKFDEKTWAEVTKGIPTDYLDRFYQADSLEEAYHIRSKLTRELEIENSLAQEGWEGFSARMLASFADPAAFGAVAATEGFAAPWVLAHKTTRLGRALRAALVGAGTEGALEGFSAAQKETKGLNDVMWAMAFGGALGAPFGALARPWDKDLQQASRNMADRVINEEAAETIARATFEPTDAVKAAMAQSGAFKRGLMEERKRMAKELLATSKERKRVEAQLTAATKELDEITSLTDTDFLYKKYGDQIRQLEEQKGIKPQETKVKGLDDLKNAADNADLSRLYRALTPERKGHIGKKEAAKIKQKIDKAIEGTLKERDFRRAELEKEIPNLQNKVTELKNLVLERQDNLMRKREYNPDFKVPENVTQKVTGGKPKPDPKPTDDSAGAMRVEGSEVEEQRFDNYIDEERTLTEAQIMEDTPFAMGRMSGSGILQKTKAGAAQFFGREILADPVAGDTGRNLAGQQVRNARVQTMSAAEDMDMIFMQVAHGFVKKAVEGAWRAYARRQGKNAFTTQFAGQMRDDFFSAVTEAIRTGSREFPEEVLQAADATRELHEKLARMAKQANLAGFQGDMDSSRYIHRMYRTDKFDAAVREHGDDGVDALLTKALLNANEDMPEEVAQKIAKAIRTRFTDPTHGGDGLSFNLAFHSKDLDQLDKVLREGTDLSAEDVEFVKDYLRANDVQDGKSGVDVNFAKKRLDMDEAVEIETRYGTLRFSDLVENNAELLAMRYARSMAGHIAFARKMGPMLRNEFGDEYVRHGVRTDLEMDKLVALAKKQGRENQMTKSQIDRMVERMRMSYAMLTGRPPTAGTEKDLGRIARFVRDWNFVRLMGQVGAAQLAELGPVFGQVGFSMAFKNLGAFRRLWKNRQTNEFTEPMLRELEEFGYVVGVERSVFQPSYRMEEYGLESTRADNIVQKMDVGMQHLKRAVADVSGMSGITAALQRFAAINAGQKFIKMAKKGKMDANRMRTLGLDDDMQKRVMKQLDQYSGKVTMESGRKADVLNLKDWDDDVARQAFMAAMHRWGSRMVQRNFIGEMPLWMHTVWGQLLGQFRSFVFTAYEKQLLQGLNAADRATALTFMWSMVFGGAAYMGQTYLNSFGREDRDEYLEENLSAYRIGTSAFQRAGFASLIPGAVDTMVTVPFLDEGIFNGRSTGLATNLIEGNPTVNLATSALSLGSKSIKNLVRDDYQYTGSDIRAGFGLLAFGNTWGMRNVEAMLAGDRPYRNTSEPLTLENYLGID